MRKEGLPQFNQRRFYEGSGKSKKESTCETETGKQHNFTPFKITALCTCTSRQLTRLCRQTAFARKFFVWLFVLQNVFYMEILLSGKVPLCSSCERQYWREFRRGWHFKVLHSFELKSSLSPSLIFLKTLTKSEF